MAKIVAVTNQKGGVGKTTTTINLAAAVAKCGKRVLLVDLDPQGNATSGVGINKSVENTAYEMIMGICDAKEAILKTAYDNLWVIPAHSRLTGAELELIDVEGRESSLKTSLLSVYGDFDFVFIDCPPSLSLLTLNALVASDSVLIPVQCEFFALEGLSQLMGTVRNVKRLYNSRIEIEGVLFTMFEGRKNLTSQVAHEVKKFFPKKVYGTVIPRNVRLSEAPSYGEPICYYDKTSKGAKAYDELADEFLKQNKHSM